MYKLPNGHKRNPYVFGLGDEGLMNDSQYEFYDWFRHEQLVRIPEKDFNEALKQQPNWQRRQSITTQMELMVYLKFWESNLVLKHLVNLCRLIHAEPYDWHLKLGHSKKKVIEFGIKTKLKRLIPKLDKLLSQIYVRQIRNAIAHSQFRVAPDNLNLFNHDPAAGFHLHNITLIEWEEIFHKTMLFYNYLIGNLYHYETLYREKAHDKHFGLQIRITRTDGIRNEFLRLKTASDVNSQWIWYRTYDQYYVKRFHIISR